MKSLRKIIVALLLISPPALCKGDELSGSGVGNLKRGGLLFPLNQFAENVSDGKKVKEAYRLMLTSGFSLEDVVLIRFEDGGTRVFWRSGLYKNVKFGSADVERFEKQYQTNSLSALLKMFQEEEIWDFDNAFTGEAMDDGGVVMFAKLTEGKETVFRAHQGGGGEGFAAIARFERLGDELWKAINKKDN